MDILYIYILHTFSRAKFFTEYFKFISHFATFYSAFNSLYILSLMNIQTVIIIKNLKFSSIGCAREIIGTDLGIQQRAMPKSSAEIYRQWYPRRKKQISERNDAAVNDLYWITFKMLLVQLPAICTRPLYFYRLSYPTLALT